MNFFKFVKTALCIFGLIVSISVVIYLVRGTEEIIFLGSLVWLVALFVTLLLES